MKSRCPACDGTGISVVNEDALENLFTGKPVSRDVTIFEKCPVCNGSGDAEEYNWEE